MEIPMGGPDVITARRCEKKALFCTAWLPHSSAGDSGIDQGKPFGPRRNQHRQYPS
ncbi:hypothetical protein P7K49_014370 [Saguinus oedipus]|uniref:Uncharacterized protein n=1 Tax=Saguinus oedipus TaxID=9490 RepID=A0ABQ9VIL4_SAGOE|nr:hypothetical protein P7K49_014370 [Saguinus oedipus]